MIKPMLAKLEPKAFKDENHVWEIKYDGVRAITVVTEQVRIWGRSGNEKTHQFPELDIQTKAPAILDGEIVCYNGSGRSEFNAIQHRNRQNKRAIMPVAVRGGLSTTRGEIVSIFKKSWQVEPRHSPKQLWTGWRSNAPSNVARQVSRVASTVVKRR